MSETRTRTVQFGGGRTNVYSAVIDGIEYTPANRTTMRIRRARDGAIVASLRITGTWSAHAGTNCPDCDDYIIESEHDSWEDAPAPWDIRKAEADPT